VGQDQCIPMPWPEKISTRDSNAHSEKLLLSPKCQLSSKHREW
jgi:hypothetical protein